MLKHWKRTLALLGVVAATGLICAAVALAKKPSQPPPPPPEPPQAMVQYEIRFLGRLPGDAGSYALDVNDHGVVLGHSWYPDLGWCPWVVVPEDIDGDGFPDLWYRDDDGDGVNDLMVLVNDLIDPDSRWNLRQVGGVNDSGQIVGHAYNANGEIHAYRLTPGTPAVVEDLGTLPGDVVSWGSSINDAGHVVGRSFSPNPSRAFVYKDWDDDGTEEMGDIGDLGGGSAVALAVSNAGWVTGSSSIDISRPNHAFRYKAGIGMEDLGDLTSKGNGYSQGWGINDAGHVAGSSYTATKVQGRIVSHAFLYTDEGGMKDLGTLGGSFSSASDINSDDDVVGDARESEEGGHFDNPPLHGFLYTTKTDTGESAMFKLQDLLVNPQDVVGPISAHDINEAGQISGSADDEAILLTPLP